MVASSSTQVPIKSEPQALLALKSQTRPSAHENPAFPVFTDAIRFNENTATFNTAQIARAVAIDDTQGEDLNHPSFRHLGNRLHCKEESR